MVYKEKRGATEKYLDDAAITAKIKAKLAADSLVSALNIHVKTENCDVTLSGEVPNSESSKKAIEIAKNTVGVNKVDSQLYISDK